MNLFQGNMETILEILQAQRAHTSANPTATNVTNVVGVTNATADAVSAVDTPGETVASTVMNHPLFPSAANRLAISYPCGMPPNFVSQFSNGGAFIPHQDLAAHNVAENVVFQWGAPTIQTPPTVDAANSEDAQG